jgi:hypothetical protein
MPPENEEKHMPFRFTRRKPRPDLPLNAHMRRDIGLPLLPTDSAALLLGLGGRR